MADAQWIVEDLSAALAQLREALAEPARLDLIKADCIQYYEFSFELGWKACKVVSAESTSSATADWWAPPWCATSPTPSPRTIEATPTPLPRAGVAGRGSPPSTSVPTPNLASPTSPPSTPSAHAASTVPCVTELCIRIATALPTPTLPTSGEGANTSPTCGGGEEGESNADN